MCNLQRHSKHNCFLIFYFAIKFPPTLLWFWLFINLLVVIVLGLKTEDNKNEKAAWPMILSLQRDWTEMCCRRNVIIIIVIIVMLCHVTLLGCTAFMQRIYVACCKKSRLVCAKLIDAVWDMDSGRPNELCFKWGLDSPLVKGQFFWLGDICRPIVKYMEYPAQANVIW